MDTQQPYQNFTDLVVWQSARALKNNVYELIKSFPGEEKFKLSDQLLRASRSICANIAEGHGRFTYKDQIHFCIQARGSLSEVTNHLIDANDCNYIDKEQFKKLKQDIDNLGKLLNGYISFLRSNLKQQ